MKTINDQNNICDLARVTLMVEEREEDQPRINAVFVSNWSH